MLCWAALDFARSGDGSTGERRFVLGRLVVRGRGEKRVGRVGWFVGLMARMIKGQWMACTHRL